MGRPKPAPAVPGLPLTRCPCDSPGLAGPSAPALHRAPRAAGRGLQGRVLGDVSASCGASHFIPVAALYKYL